MDARLADSAPHRQPQIESRPQGFDAGSINQNTETHEGKMVFTLGSIKLQARQTGVNQKLDSLRALIVSGVRPAALAYPLTPDT